MRARIDSITLVGGGRRVDFAPGLNIVTGPITTGKTTLLRLCRLLLSSGLDIGSFPREARDHIQSVAGQVTVGDSQYSIMRPFVGTTTAKVDIATIDASWRLPAVQLDSTASMTYGQWLLRTLGLPELRVPSAPTQPESTPTPVTINDYFLYCILSQEEIDKSVFDHLDTFKNIKRRYVFEIIYGLYSIAMAQLQEDLRVISSELRQLSSLTTSFERFLQGTSFENRAALAAQLEQARVQLAEVEQQTVVNSHVIEISTGGSLREELRLLESAVDEHRQQIARERAAVNQLTRLANQLEAQSASLTRSIVAENYLLDFEFMICPRCATPVDIARGNENSCGLCLQVPRGSRPDRVTLIAEQDRIGIQIQETRELVTIHQEAVAVLERQVAENLRSREAMAQELNFLTQSYVSDQAAFIAALAAERSRLMSEIAKLSEYQLLYLKLDQTLGVVANLEARKQEAEAQLDVQSTRGADAEDRIKRLEKEFERILDIFNAPRFGDIRQARIDRRTFLPVLDGRRFDELSSQGLQVLVNVAHALAHHRTSIALNLGLPQILFIDGPTSNLGHEGEDLKRIHAIYDYLIEISRELGDQLQIIVADNDVPGQAEPFVRVRLSESLRLIQPEGRGSGIAVG